MFHYFMYGLLCTNLFANEKVFEGAKVEKIKKISLESTSGDIKIEKENTPNKIFVSSDSSKGKDTSCTVEVDEKSSELKISVKGKKNDCKTDFSLKVPQNVELDIKLGAGDILIDKVGSKIDFKSGAGDVSLTDSQVSEVEGKLGAGDIKIEYSAEISNLKNKRKIELKLGAGDIKIVAPKDILVKHSGKNGWGNINNELKDVSNKDNWIELDSKLGTGDLTIKGK